MGHKMLRELIGRFSDVTALPVEVDEIAKCITNMGVQDEIYLFPTNTDTEKIRGAHYQFTYHKSVYGEPQRVTHVVYSKNDALEWQRVIAVKEMVHIFDDDLAKTNTDDEVNQLLDKLVGPHSSEDFGLADYQATKDRLALYQSLPLLMPRAALDQARQAVRNKSRTPHDIAKWSCMPVELIRLMLSDEWVSINGALDEL